MGNQCRYRPIVPSDDHGLLAMAGAPQEVGKMRPRIERGNT
jgi:hypothetical protein